MQRMARSSNTSGSNMREEAMKTVYPGKGRNLNKKYNNELSNILSSLYYLTVSGASTI